MTDLQHNGSDDHAQLRSCAAYLLGGLDPEAEREFERHLGTCLSCLDECDRLGPLVTEFGAVGPVEAAAFRAEIDDLCPVADQVPPAASAGTAVSASGTADPAAGLVVSAEGAASPGAGSAQASPEGVPVKNPAADLGRQRDPEAAGSTRPGKARPARSTVAPGRSSRLRGGLRHRLTLASLALIAVVSSGTAAFLASSGDPDPVGTRSVAVTAEGTGASTRLSVVVTPGDTATEQRDALPIVQITATVTGLAESEKYQLYAVTGDGDSHRVTEWTAGSGSQEVSGEAEVSIDDLAFFSVIRADGGAVVSARIARTPD